MPDIARPDQPAAASPGAAAGGRHTLWCLLAFYALAVLTGARNIWAWKPSGLDVVLPAAGAVALGWWAVTDARRRGLSIPAAGQMWFILLAGVVVPVYVVWSRGWRGAGWVLLHFVLWNALSVLVMEVGRALVFGDA